MMRAEPMTLLLVGAVLIGCGRVEQVGKRPEFSPVTGTNEHFAMNTSPLPAESVAKGPGRSASLWRSGRRSLLGDRRASRAGDILTVAIEIDEKAEISNSTSRSRSGTEEMSIAALFGLPENAARELPAGASLSPGVSTSSSSDASGDGSVRRNEQLELRIAATVTGVLPSGALRIEGSQEIRVNYEVRELRVTGFVRPEDISRQNEITYDEIAQARISYGGRGRISEMQQPRWGQQLADAVLPF